MTPMDPALRARLIAGGGDVVVLDEEMPDEDATRAIVAEVAYRWQPEAEDR